MTVELVASTGAVIPLPVERWRAAPDEVEHALLGTVAEPVLDIGCGPGRLAAALAAAGRVTLGIDPSPAAVAESRRRGAPVLLRSVFEHLPGEGRWASALLLDGNIGIGGDPVALLGRVRALLRPTGEAVVEVEPPGTPTERLVVRLRPAGRDAGPPFSWARVGADGIGGVARQSGMGAAGLDVRGGRWFARLRPA